MGKEVTVSRIDVLKSELVEHQDQLDKLQEGFTAEEASMVLKLQGVVLGLGMAVTILEGVEDEQC